MYVNPHLNFAMSLIGTATAFFVGFKNNQAYGHNREARIIWGANTNSSRAFGASPSVLGEDNLPEKIQPEFGILL